MRGDNELPELGRVSAIHQTAPPFDAARYWAHLDQLDASDAEKTALLEVMWSIMATFVNLGFGTDPVQQIIPRLVQTAMSDDEAKAPQCTPALQFNTAAVNDPEKEARDDP